MSTEDRDKLRSVSFKEFADEWLDKLKRKYDAIGDAWIDTFRPDIASYLQAMGERVDTLINLLTYLDNDEAIRAFLAEFGGEQKYDIPSYEALIPAIRSLGGKDNDTALTIIGIFRYEAGLRRLRSTSGDNIGVD